MEKGREIKEKTTKVSFILLQHSNRAVPLQNLATQMKLWSWVEQKDEEN